jgi:hypothetical protein
MRSHHQRYQVFIVGWSYKLNSMFVGQKGGSSVADVGIGVDGKHKLNVIEPISDCFNGGKNVPERLAEILSTMARQQYDPRSISIIFVANPFAHYFECIDHGISSNMDRSLWHTLANKIVARASCRREMERR